MKFAVCCGGLHDAARTAACLSSHRVSIMEAGPRFFLENGVKEVTAAAGVFRDHGVTIRSVHAPFRGGHNLSSEDPSIRARTIETYYGFLEKVAAAKARIVVIHPGDRAPDDRHEEMHRLCADSVSALAPRAAEFGIMLAIENLHPGLPGQRGEDLVRIVEQVGSPAVGLCHDSGHAHMSGNAAEILRVMAPHIVTFHLHDNDGRRDLHLPPPFGTLDWESWMRVFEAMKFEDALTLECSPWGDEIPSPGRGVDSNFSALLDGVRDFYNHLKARLRHEEDELEINPGWKFRGIAPHRADMQV